MPRFYLLTGLTGSGKTRVLKHLQKIGEQVVDLECITGHSGSVFGSINRQPLEEQRVFEEQLWQQLLQCSESRPVFIESKGEYIGKLLMPSWMMRIQNASAKIFIDTPQATRLSHILTDYQLVTLDQFKSAFEKIKNKIPEDLQAKSLAALQHSDRVGFIKLMLLYFDDSPNYKLMKKNADMTIQVGHHFDEDEITNQLRQCLTGTFLPVDR